MILLFFIFDKLDCISYIQKNINEFINYFNYISFSIKYYLINF